MVLYLSLRTIFVLLFKWGMRFWLRFSFSPVDVQLRQCHLLKRHSPWLNCFCILVRNCLGIFVWVYFLVLYSVPLVCICLSSSMKALIPVAMKVLKLGRLISLLLFFFFKKILAILVSLPFHINFRIVSSISTRDLAKIWTGIALNLHIHVGIIDIFLCWVS